MDDLVCRDSDGPFIPCKRAPVRRLRFTPTGRVESYCDHHAERILRLFSHVYREEPERAIHPTMQAAYDELVAEHYEGHHADAMVYGCPSCEDEHSPLENVQRRGTGQCPRLR